MIGFISVLAAAVKSVTAAVLLTAWATGLAVRGAVDQPFLSKLSYVAKTMFLPCLAFDAMASGLSIDFLQDNWQLPCCGMFVMASGLICGQILARIARVPKLLKPWFVLGVSMPNMIALPLVLLEAICREENAARAAISTCIANGTTRLFSVSFAQTPVFWTVCYAYAASCTEESTKPLCRKGSTKEAAADTAVDAEACTDSSPIGKVADETVPVSLTGHAVAPQDAQEAADKDGMCRTVLRSLMEPPVVANFVALPFAFVPWLHDMLYGQGAPFSFLASGIAVLGKASPGLTNLILGGTLGLQLLSLRKDDPFGLQALGISWPAMLLLVVGRIIIVPALCFTCLTLFIDFLPDDRLSRLLLFFQPAGVTANVVTVLAQLLDRPDGARLIALASIPQMFMYIFTSTVLIALGIRWTEDA